MNVNDLMNKISDYSEIKKKDEEQALLEKHKHIDDLKDMIKEKSYKIAELIKLGNHALKNNIIKPYYAWNDYLTGRKYGYFFTDGWFHYLGFVWDYSSEKITHLGIEGGGYFRYNLKVNEKELVVSSKDTDREEDVLTRFVEEFDKFEKDFVNYITKTIEKK